MQTNTFTNIPRASLLPLSYKTNQLIESSPYNLLRANSPRCIFPVTRSINEMQEAKSEAISIARRIDSTVTIKTKDYNMSSEVKTFSIYNPNNQTTDKIKLEQFTFKANLDGKTISIQALEEVVQRSKSIFPQTK